jgi:hypothetical protein
MFTDKFDYGKPHDLTTKTATTIFHMASQPIEGDLPLLKLCFNSAYRKDMLKVLSK